MVLIGDYPAKVAQQLIEGSIDVGLVPVAVIPHLKEYHIVGSYCIGANDKVASVGIYSECPIKEVETLMLDYQSRTSVALAQVLLKHYWKVQPAMVPAHENFREDIQGTTAAVVIGDRALEQNHISAYCYDLAEAWKIFTGLPFVFAAWISNKPLPAEFIQELDEANRLGFSHLPEIVAANPFPHIDLLQYYTKHISYTIDKEKLKGLELFLQYLRSV